MLSAEQVRSYERDGFLVVPDALSETELSLLRGELPAIYGQDHPRNHLVPGMLRTVRAPHEVSDAFALLYRLPRLVEPARQLLGSDVYLHQFKVNAKLPFSREPAPWHQEYRLWHNADAMPQPRALIVALFLDEVNEFNGPLTFMAGSHKEGFVDEPDGAHVFGQAQAQLQYFLDRRTAARLAGHYPMVAPKGPAGSLVIFHCTTVHGSAPSISPSRRDLALIAYNSFENALRPVALPRPEYAASRDFATIRCVDDDALVRMASRRIAAEESGAQPLSAEVRA